MSNSTALNREACRLKPILPAVIFGVLIVMFLVLAATSKAAENDPRDILPALAQTLSATDDIQFQLDLLRGISAALKGQRSVPMPRGWEAVEARFTSSGNEEVRALAQSISLIFGSERALAALSKVVADATAEVSARRTALESLLNVREASLAPVLQQLLKDPGLRGAALRGLAAYDDPQTPVAILGVYPSLAGAEKRDALNTLCSRAAYAKPLLGAIESGAVSVKDLSADLIRQLRSLKHSEIEQLLVKVYGVTRESSTDKQKEIERYKRLYYAGGSQPGDGPRGRVVFNRVCHQCHVLFDTGGKVGPDITGANRNDLDYLLQTIIDPNAVIPNEYRTSTIEMKDERVLTGILREQTPNTLVVQTANELLTLNRAEVKKVDHSEISMMPEGLLTGLQDQEYRDLIYYLTRPGQVPLPVNPN